MAETKNIPVIFKLLVFYRIITITIPYLVYHSLQVINGIVVVAIFLIGLHLLGSQGGHSIKRLLPLMILLFVDYILAIFCGTSLNLVLFAYGLVQFMLLPLTVMIMYNRQDYKFAKQALWVFIVCYIITSITTIIGCRTNPGAARALAAIYHEKDQALIDLYNSLNIGGFDFVYNIVLLIPLFLFLIRFYNRFAIRFILCLILFLFINVIIETEYTIALVFSLASVLLFFLPRDCSTKHLYIIGICGVIIGVTMKTILLPIFASLGDIIGSELVSSRVTDISAILTGGQTSGGDGDTDNRMELYRTSFNAFVSSPIWGTGDDKGGHSLILGYMSKFGIIGIGILLYYFKKVYNFAILPIRSYPMYVYALFVFFIQIALTILNPYMASNIFIVIIPLVMLAYGRVEIMSNEKIPLC